MCWQTQRLPGNAPPRKAALPGTGSNKERLLLLLLLTKANVFWPRRYFIALAEKNMNNHAGRKDLQPVIRL